MRCGRTNSRPRDHRFCTTRSPEPVLYDLPLLFHAVLLKRLRRFAGVIVWACAPAPTVAQLAHPIGNGPDIVAPGAPGLVLATMRQLVSQDWERIAAIVGKEDVVPQRNASSSGASKHHRSEPSRRPVAAAPVEANSGEVHRQWELGQRPGFGIGESLVVQSAALPAPVHSRVPGSPVVRCLANARANRTAPLNQLARMARSTESEVPRRTARMMASCSRYVIRRSGPTNGA